MKKIIILIAVILVTASQARTKCSQFDDQREAQRYYDSHKKGYKSLDRDKDGEACECLRGGSSYGSSVCNRWRKKNNKR